MAWQQQCAALMTDEHGNDDGKYDAMAAWRVTVIADSKYGDSGDKRRDDIL